MRTLSIAFLALLVCGSAAMAQEVRSASHTKYATQLWDFLRNADYHKWAKSEAIDKEFGPPPCHEGSSFANAMAIKTKPNYEHGSVVITDNQDEGSEKTASVTVWFRVKPGFDAKRGDWYWAVFSPEGKVIKTSADKNPHDQRGFYVQEEDGRLWVFHIHSEELGAFLADGDLAQRVTRVSAGPGGETIMSGSAADIDAYLAVAKPAPAEGTDVPQNDGIPVKEGFVTMIEDGRLWIFKQGSEELAEYKKSGDLAQRVTRVSAGPKGMTVMAPDAETIDAYLAE